MKLKSFFPLVLLISISNHSRSASMLETFLNLKCNIHFVTESGLNHHSTAIDLFDSAHSERSILPWTYYDVGRLDFGFDGGALGDQEFSISQNSGFLRFTYRYGDEPCILFILETKTLNTTTLAIERSGYQYSKNAYFLIISTEDEHEKLEALHDISSNIFIHYANINTLSATCNHGYTRTNKILNAATREHKICHHLVNELSAVVHLQTLGQTKISAAIRSKNCGTSKRELLYKGLNKRESGYITGMLTAGKLLNISFASTTDPIDIEDSRNQMTIYWFPLLNSGYPNYQLLYRSHMRISAQAKFNVMYCGRMSVEYSLSWIQYTAVIEFRIWIALLLIFISISVVYKSVFRALDFGWLLVGKPLTKVHSRALAFAVMMPLGILFAIYSAGFSTNNISVNTPTSLKDLAANNYKFQFPKFVTSAIMVAATEVLQSSINDAFGIKRFSDILLIEDRVLEIKNGSLSEILNRLEHKENLGIADLRRGVLSSHPFLSNILGFADKVVINNKYVCGSIPLPESVYSNIQFGYIMWGSLSNKLNEIVSRFDEVGIIDRIQQLIVLAKLNRDDTDWAPLRTTVRVPKPLSLQSPLGTACRGNLISSTQLLVIFLLYKYREKCFTVVAVIKDLASLLRYLVVNYFIKLPKLCIRNRYKLHIMFSNY